MSDLTNRIRAACARVAATARHVSIVTEAIPAYAASLALEPPLGLPSAAADPATTGSLEERAAFWLTLDAINFGSGWFPTLRKRDGRSGYHTVAAGIKDRFATAGPWSAGELARIDAAEVAATLGQDPGHELMGLFARSLNDLGDRVAREYGGSFRAVPEGADRSAVALAERLADWECFADVSTYDGEEVPFYKRAQIAAADLADADPAGLRDLDRLTMFADNLVPHVLRLDGILRFAPDLVARIEREELIDHGSPEEVEIRACALHAVELIVAARPPAPRPPAPRPRAARPPAPRPPASAAQVDRLLWNRGGGASYKAVPRHRSRCTAY